MQERSRVQRFFSAVENATFVVRQKGLIALNNREGNGRSGVYSFDANSAEGGFAQKIACQKIMRCR
jgi:hypothetical protein